MAKNHIHNGERIPVKAAAARTSGVPCVEAGFVGFPETSAAIGAVYTLELVGIHEIALLASSAVGDTVHIDPTTGVLTRTARGTVGGGATVPLGSVVAIPTDPGPTFGPKAGSMWVRVKGQTV